jgi:RNA polymerase sigma-70 factor (ECF subfamily)
MVYSILQNKTVQAAKQHTDHETVLHLIAGYESAFDALYRQYFGGLCAFASQYVPQAEGEEIVQDVMMWLWENRRTIAAEMSVKSLLFTIVKNKCLNSISHRQIKQRVHEDLYQKFVDCFEDPDFYVHGELVEKLNQAIQNLPEDYRKAFEMNRFEELTYREIAAQLGVSPKTVAYRISQSLKILRIELKDFLPLLYWLLHY